MQNNNAPLVMTPEEARQMLRCSRGVIYRAIHEGLIPSIRISQRKIVIPRATFMAWLNGAKPQ